MYSFTIDEKKNAPFLMVQHRFGGMRDQEQNRGGMLDMRIIEGGIRDENFLTGSGYAHFNWGNAG